MIKKCINNFLLLFSFTLVLFNSNFAFSEENDSLKLNKEFLSIVEKSVKYISPDVKDKNVIILYSNINLDLEKKLKDLEKKYISLSVFNYKEKKYDNSIYVVTNLNKKDRENFKDKILEKNQNQENYSTLLLGSSIDCVINNSCILGIQTKPNVIIALNKSLIEESNIKINSIFLSLAKIL